MGVQVFSFQNVWNHFVAILISIPLLFYGKVSAQIILTEVMFDADTLESHNEYIEIYNLSNQHISLQGWQIGDSLELDVIIDAGEGMQLSAKQFAVILDASYFQNSTTYDNLIPDTALILTIDDGSFGRSGWSNSVSEPVVLRNNQNELVQKYTYSLGNQPGFSDEKINMTVENSAENWGNSLILRGTPGFTNSLTPKNLDLSVDSLWQEVENISAGDPLIFNVLVKNAGQTAVSNFVLQLFIDENLNGQLDASEIIEEKSVNMSLVPGDSAQLKFTEIALAGGWQNLGVFLLLDGDEKMENNLAFTELFIPSPGPSVVINEIMYAPFSGWSEWVEIYNTAQTELDLKNWFFADTQDTVRITANSFLFSPGEFLILAKDSVTLSEYGLSGQPFLAVKGFPVLNNTEDFLKILNPHQTTVDQVAYQSEWIGSNVDNGISLERIRPDISSMLPENWGACVNARGHTAAEKNSLFIDKYNTTSEIKIQPNPFSPDNDGFEDVTLILYQFPFSKGFLTIDIFDMLGRKIRRLKSNLPVGQSGQVIWDGRDKNGDFCRMGLYIILLQTKDQNGESYKNFKKSVALVKR